MGVFFVEGYFFDKVNVDWIFLGKYGYWDDIFNIFVIYDYCVDFGGNVVF